MPTTGSAKSIQENLILVQNILQKHVTLTNFNKCSTSYTLKTEEKELFLGGDVSNFIRSDQNKVPYHLVF